MSTGLHPVRIMLRGFVALLWACATHAGNAVAASSDDAASASQNDATRAAVGASGAASSATANQPPPARPEVSHKNPKMDGPPGS
jgi:hypothetical protein